MMLCVIALLVVLLAPEVLKVIPDINKHKKSLKSLPGAQAARAGGSL